jgi:Protein of unknown function (DUF3570)
MRSIALKTLGAAVVSTFLATPARAGGEAIDFRWHHFSDNQGTNVSTTTFDVAKPFGSESGRIAITYSLDMVSMPAIEGVPGSEEHLDALTTASRPVSGDYQESDTYQKRRHQLEGAVGMRSFTGTFYTSIEEDWHAYQAGLSWQRQLAEENTLLALDGSLGWDQISPIVEEGTPTRDDRRTSLSMVGTWQQTIDVRTQSRLALEVGQIRGYQANPYRSVRTDSTIVAEVHPRERLRTALSAEVIRYLDTRSSVRLGYRLYRDDWDLLSHTGNLEFKQALGDLAVLRYRYRYYTQNGASFYREDYVDANGVDGYLTADYKLAPLASNLFGVKLEVPALDLLHLSRVFTRADLVLKVERYYTSTDFSAGIFETGIEVAF